MRRAFLGPLVLVVLAVGFAAFKVAAAPASASSAPPFLGVGSKAPGVLSEGQTLYAESCASCHGSAAQGTTIAPRLLGVGPATVDLWLKSGWMPLANPNVVQPPLKPPAFTSSQTQAIVSYVASLSPGGPPIPPVNIAGADLSKGFQLFSENCAACHTVTGAGDALSNGSFAPSLHQVQVRPTQVGEAIRTGPLQMPVFSIHQLTPRQVDQIAAYVAYLHHPKDRGGIPLGWVGPVPEGFVALAIGVIALMLLALWVGGRHREV